ncbi:hypothetical protein [Devosia sp.]|uniref:hypothetical protein n=1 Tax=Devosia sp. TaxID=1871048 RepID=UPI00292CB70A|nr:hypothetical protein [Devosia sp.]
MTDKRNKRRNPILNMREFELQHAEREVQLKNYMTTKRGRAAIDSATADTLKDQAALSLKANATLARVEFARALAAQAEKRAGEMKFPFFLTLAPAQFSMSIADAPRFDVEKIIVWGKRVLAMCDHVTFVEAALYTNFQAPGQNSRGAVHWHLHSVVWGDEYHASGIMGDMYGDPQPTFIPGLRLAHERPLSPDMVAGRFLYMAKAPLSEYRVYAQMKEIKDLTTGEVFEVPSGSYIQRKRALRPGEASLLCRILGSRDLPSLTFAGGEGQKLLLKALSKARTAIGGKVASL